MGKEEDRQKYLRNCATTFQGRLGLKAEEFKECKTLADIQRELLKHKWSSVFVPLYEAPDEQIGKLACSNDVEQVRRMATDALLSAIAVKIWAELNPKRVLKCRFCDFTVAKRYRGSRATGFDIMREHIDAAHPDEAKHLTNAIYGSREARDEADEEDYADSVKQ